MSNQLICKFLEVSGNFKYFSFMFDEPSFYLDVKQRLRAARIIRALLSEKVYVVVVEHDLSVLDYLSDFICCLYGTPGAYVVSLPCHSVLEKVIFNEFSIIKLKESIFSLMVLFQLKICVSVTLTLFQRIN